MMFYSTFSAPICEITLIGDASGLAYLHMDTGQSKREFTLPADCRRDDDLFAAAKAQLLEYFAGARQQFDLLLNPTGTPFQIKVWQELSRIPYGQTRSYKDIATALGNPNSTRAVGMANSRNPIPIIVPCHRVIGASGKLTGYAHGLAAKEALLALEKSN